MLSTQPYKGARDFYPEDKRRQKYLFRTIRKVVESFGYEEYDAPLLEPTELYLIKGNEEIITEQTYSFEDRGGRAVTIRTEMTPSVSRMVASRRQDLAYPARWYSIPNLWRYERPQRSRGREFYQLNVDVFGIAGLSADHEVILVADSIMKAFGAKPDMYQIRINSRKLINALTQDYLGLDTTQSQALIRLIDRKNKLEPAQFIALAEALFTPSQREQGALQRLMSVMDAKTIEDLPPLLQTHDSAKQQQQLLRTLSLSGVTTAQFDVTLMRGFDYYTDVVFEVFDTHPDNNRAMFGGGRYDGLVGSFGVEPIPTVGFGMGDMAIDTFLETHKLWPVLPPETDAYVILIGEVYTKAQKVLGEMRAEGLRIAIDTTNRKIDKQIKSAVKMRIPHIIFIGDSELDNERFKLKNLVTGTEAEMALPRLITALADHRKKPRPVDEV